MSSSILKKLAFLMVLLVAVLLVHLYKEVPHRKEPFASIAMSAEQIILTQGPQKVPLSKKAGNWKVLTEDSLSHPADAERIKTLLASLKDLQIEDEISDRTDRFSEYQVDDSSGIRISLRDAKGLPQAEGIFGKSAPDFAHSYFRYPGQSHVYLARGVLPGDLGKVQPNYWRSHQLIDLGEAQIRSVTIEGKGFKTSLVRASTDTWSINGEPVESPPVDALLGALAHLRVDDFIDAKSTPVISPESLTHAEITVQGTDAPVTIRIGSQEPKTKRYPVSTGADAGLAWASEASMNAILQKPSAFKTK